MRPDLLSNAGKFAGGTLCSVIFAPAPQNYTLSSVTNEMDFGEAIALEVLTNPEAFVTGRMFESVRRLGPELKELFRTYLRDYCETSMIMSSLMAPTKVSSQKTEQVPARRYPSSTHLNLLTLPTVEGLSFDPDDFVER